MQFIAFDSHRHYTLATVEKEKGGVVLEARIPHDRGALREFLSQCEPGSPVSIETIGNWYWIVSEIEEAGFVPKLVHARKAGDLLIAGQLPDGGFTEELRLTEAGVKPVGNQGVLEDHTTDRATELLLQLFDATGDKKYLAAGRKAVDFLIKAQYPSGAFPQRYPINKQSLTGPYSGSIPSMTEQQATRSCA